MDTSVEVRKGFVGYLARPVASGAQKKKLPQFLSSPNAGFAAPKANSQRTIYRF